MSAGKLFGAATTFALILGASASAFAWAPLDNSYPVWQNIPVTYKVNQSTLPGSIAGIAVARIDQGFADWGGEACTFFSATNQGDTALKYNSNDGKNTLHWISSSWPGTLGDVNSVIGVTPLVFSAGDIFDADIVFNDVGFCWNDNGQGNCVDTKSIVTHEEGHFLGLGHSNVNGATMEPFYAGPSQGSLAQDDKDGVCALYPIGGATAASSSGSGAVNCDTCVNDSTYGACAGAYDACGSSQSCIDFYTCYSNCADQACVDNCVNSYPTGAQIYIDLIDCVCSDCAVECVNECGGSGSSSTTAASSSGNTSSSATTTGDTTASTGTGAGGSDPTGSGGAGATSSSSGGGKKKKNNNDSTEVGGCATTAPAGSSAAFGVLAALGAALAMRRRRSSK